MSWGCHADLRYIVTELVTNMRPAHNTIVKTEWNNFRLIHFIVWVLINMFVVCCHQVIQASYQVPLSRVKIFFIFPTRTPYIWQLLGSYPSMIMGIRGADTIFHADLSEVKQFRQTPTPGWPGLLVSAGQWRNETAPRNETSLKYNPNLFSLH